MDTPMLPRLLVTQSVHAARWKGPPGQFVSVDPNGQKTVIGPLFVASVLAMRQAAIRVDKHCSEGPAVERYHDPKTKDFRHLEVMARQGSGSFCYAGPELLLYLHGSEAIVTFLLADKAVANRFAELSHVNRPKTFKVTERSNGGHFSWYSTAIAIEKDLNWNRRGRFTEQINNFENDPGISDPVSKAKDVVVQQARSLSKEQRRRFWLAIQQANDGDYWTDADTDELLNGRRY